MNTELRPYLSGPSYPKYPLVHFRESSELLRGKGQSIAGGGRPPCEPYPKILRVAIANTTHNSVLYLAHEHTRGLEGQPPVQYEHEVVTGDGDVDTLLQATP